MRKSKDTDGNVANFGNRKIEEKAYCSYLNKQTLIVCLLRCAEQWRTLHWRNTKLSLRMERKSNGCREMFGRFSCPLPATLMKGCSIRKNKVPSVSNELKRIHLICQRSVQNKFLWENCSGNLYRPHRWVL